MPKYTVPKDGAKIGYQNGKLVVPDNPIIPFFPGDGTGPDLWRATKIVLDGAVERAYKGASAIDWPEGFYRRDIGWSALRSLL